MALEATPQIPTEPQQQRMLIGGSWAEAVDGQRFAVENPARRLRIATVPRAQAADVDLAVDAASKAFASWRKIVPRERGRMLLKIAEGLEAQIEEMARTIAAETGNAVRTQARPEARTAADIFRYFGGLGGEMKGLTIPLGDGHLSYSRREPLGVVGAIVPWNAPVMLAALKIAPALCAGNTVVLKAAEDAPLGVLLLAAVCQAHLPPGVLNVITGFGPECGEALLRHPGVAKLSFTGSTAVGKIVMRSAVERVLPVSLELGGKSPSIVFEDANQDWVLDGVIGAMRFTRQGQSCTAGSRLLVQRPIFDSFLDGLSKKVAQLKIGDPLDEATDMGAIINERQFNKVCGYIDDGLVTPGARLLTGGRPSPELAAKGYFVPPTIFAHAESGWRLAREEIFGPVLVALPWDNEADAIRMANESHYGLAAFIWTSDIGKALRTAHEVEAGWVQINQGTGQSLGQSYGGYKQSGLGREFSLESMLDSFTQTKSVTVNLSH
jgi:acyl-CoA reductase-like NAD-dependent aldehyde dehydrogenase